MTIDFNRSFASHPKAEFWDYSKNEKKPCEVFKSSGKKFWFICGECEHSFDIQLNSVTNGGKWCPFCGNKKLCEKDCNICFEKSFGSHPKAEFWNYVKNDKKPRNVFKSSHTKFWFDCGDCEHSFDTSLGHVTKSGRWCPYCANKKLYKEYCTTCFEKSFASHPRAKFWSDRNDKVSRDVFKSSGTKFWFNCEDCEHSFDTQLGSIIRGSWCPFCANPSKRLCEEDCTQCFEKSFASHPKAKFWSDRNEKKPRDVFKSCNKKFWFECDFCEHSFDTTLGNVTYGDKWCPFCAKPPQRLCKEDCTTCFEKSFASHPKAKFWSDRNENKPREVFKSSGTKFWFDCDDNHSFETVLYSVTNGNWCPMCVNKTEKIFLEWFKNKYEYVIEHQAKYDWCKNILHLPFDFSVESLKLIIEIDGPQHYRQISNWASPEVTQERDKYKTEKALENGYNIVRILQEDIYKNVVGWEVDLVNFIKAICVHK